MKRKSNLLCFRLVLIAFILVLSLLLGGCDTSDNTTTTASVGGSEDSCTTSANGDTQQSSTTTSNGDGEQSSTTASQTGDNGGNDTEELPDYFVATVTPNSKIAASPYIGDSSVSQELTGVYYSSDNPGGEPQNNGTGKIWLKLTPLEKYCIASIDIKGECTEIKNLGNDIYCIYGVRSDLTVSMMSKALDDINEEIFDGYGYGISEDGTMTVTWRAKETDPLRYVEISYLDDSGYQVKYFDASLCKAELFKMKENQLHTVSLRAISYKNIGKRVDIKGYYMNEPREVSFPRVEITTEDYIWPTFDNAKKPSNAMGAGITNAFYEQCIVTLYNENNEVVFSSSSNKTEEEEYLGAKLKVRGNTSAAHAKDYRYPYKIKLDEKFDMLAPLIGREDDGKSYADKDWLLLNYGEEVYRVCGDAVADAVGTEWSPDYCYVSLYVNGDYRGLYVLSEAVEKGSGSGEDQWRVAVDDDGFVFECDAYWWNENVYFDTPMTQNTRMYYTFKYPDSDILTKDSPELNYLRNYIIEFENALKKDDDSYLNYIDLGSFAKWLLVSDYLCISDGGGCNIFLYKKDSSDGTKISMGPNWDFDSYMGSAQSLSTIRMYWSTAPFYYHQLIKKQSFQECYNELFYQTVGKLEGYIDSALSEIDTEAHSQLLEYQNTRFGTSVDTLTEQKEAFDIWLDEHLEWMDTQIK